MPVLNDTGDREGQCRSLSASASVSLDEKRDARHAVLEVGAAGDDEHRPRVVGRVAERRDLLAGGGHHKRRLELVGCRRTEREHKASALRREQAVHLAGRDRVGQAVGQRVGHFVEADGVDERAASDGERVCSLRADIEWAVVAGCVADERIRDAEGLAPPIELATVDGRRDDERGEDETE